MEIAGSIEISATPDTVWKALGDPGVVAHSLSGCDNFRQTGPKNYTATATIRIGPTRAQITINIDLAEVIENFEATISLRAAGGIGAVEIVAPVQLVSENHGTRLTYRAIATFSGRAKWLAGRFGEETAQELIGEFFRRFAAAIPGHKEHPDIIPPSAAFRLPEGSSAIHKRKLPWQTQGRKMALIGGGAAVIAALAAAAAMFWYRRTR